MVCAGDVWRDKTLVFKDRFKSIAPKSGMHFSDQVMDHKKQYVRTPSCHEV